jgi:hypothetical protein
LYLPYHRCRARDRGGAIGRLRQYRSRYPIGVSLARENRKGPGVTVDWWSSRPPGPHEAIRVAVAETVARFAVVRNDCGVASLILIFIPHRCMRNPMPTRKKYRLLAATRATAAAHDRDLAVEEGSRFGALSPKRMSHRHNSTTGLLVAHCSGLQAAPASSGNCRNPLISYTVFRFRP